MSALTARDLAPLVAALANLARWPALRHLHLDLSGAHQLGADPVSVAALGAAVGGRAELITVALLLDWCNMAGAPPMRG